MVPQRLDQLTLVHRRPALDPDVAGSLHQVVLGPILVVAMLAATAADPGLALRGHRVADTGGLLLALALLAQLLIRLLVLDARPGHGYRLLPGGDTRCAGG